MCSGYGSVTPVPPGTSRHTPHFTCIGADVSHQMRAKVRVTGVWAYAFTKCTQKFASRRESA